LRILADLVKKLILPSRNTFNVRRQGGHMRRTAKRTFQAACLLLLLAWQAGCELVTSGPMPQPTGAPTVTGDAPTMVPPPGPSGTNPAGIQQVSFAAPARLQPPVDGVQPTDRQGEQVGTLTVDALVQEVLARNPTLAQMIAAWQAAGARYPQVTSLEDPSLETVLAPASIGSNSVDFGGRIGVSQKLPLGGKLALRGQVALAEANAAGNDVNDVRLQLIERANNAFYDYYLVERAQSVNNDNLKLLQEARKSAD
jgi:outer membrane protein, heavy metal efflux system